MSLHTPSEQSMTDVIAGIVADFQKLVSQQLALLRAELRSDWMKTKNALMPIVVGGILAMVGLVLFGFTVAHGLHWLLTPAGMDPARLPLWACFGIACLLFIGLGSVLVMVGANAFRTFSMVPTQSADALQSNIAAIVDASSGPVR